MSNSLVTVMKHYLLTQITVTIQTAKSDLRRRILTRITSGDSRHTKAVFRVTDRKITILFGRIGMTEFYSINMLD